ncbi:BapA/Bap/LapF family prefix-like domain-containing protein [Acinetobacter gerneri]|uniref:BapA/Bap/LapF family prefix-like domain-containing protein n=1 Tax=Acinetobacter gerneri TaxID=202952 RepID=UPI003214ED6D
MSNIQVISKKTHQILEKVNNNQIKLNGDSVVQIKASAQDVLSIERSGNNAIITLKNGEKIIIENYFNAENSNSLVFDDNNQLSVLSFRLCVEWFELYPSVCFKC